jgi:serine/threonine-protein kinase
VRVFDYGASDDGVRYFAMELLVGADLATLVAAGGPMPVARAVHFARQACMSLREAHARGIVHRDIKPENLFASNAPHHPDFLKLLDFGVAKISEPVGVEDATLTQVGWLGGTPAYMPPEVCAGGEATPRSDVYSLGGVLYFLITGTPPFKAESVGALMMAHIHQPPDPPSKHTGVSPDLDEVILRCLAKKPEARFADVDALDAALARLEAAEPWTPAQAKKLWSGRLPVID